MANANWSTKLSDSPTAKQIYSLADEVRTDYSDAIADSEQRAAEKVTAGKANSVSAGALAVGRIVLVKGENEELLPGIVYEVNPEGNTASVAVLDRASVPNGRDWKYLKDLAQASNDDPAYSGWMDPRGN